MFNIKLIDEKGKYLGIYTIIEAKEIAKKKKLDLIEINKNIYPKIYKIGDYKKYLFDKNKKKKFRPKKMKELSLSTNIHNSDYNNKIKKAKSFLSKGHSIRFYINFKGRQVLYKDIGYKIFDKVNKDLGVSINKNKFINNKIVFIINNNNEKKNK
ncbi:translation initiation factor IF-3 [Candidatus Vidania fulgoroideorum]